LRVTNASKPGSDTIHALGPNFCAGMRPVSANRWTYARVTPAAAAAAAVPTNPSAKICCFFVATAIRSSLFDLLHILAYIPLYVNPQKKQHCLYSTSFLFAFMLI
jgi:hypothetical protein